MLETHRARLWLAAFTAWAMLAAQQSPRYRMTGRVSNLAAGHRATVHAHGPTNRSTTTRADGTWEMTQVQPGIYSISVTRNGYTFTPVDRTADVRNRDVHDLNFTAHPTGQPSAANASAERHSISGRVAGLAAGHHATVHAHGPTNRSATTRSDGTWEINNLVPGVYSVSVTRTGYTFSPIDRSADVRTRDAHNLNFTAQAKRP
jgi:hypothetical protein